RLYTVDSMTSLLEGCGYQVIRKEGIFLKPLTTGQLESLDLSKEILDGMCKVGVDYPELSAGLLFEAKVAT
ncbi:MAG: SAM-dependent methyltransferase, partial [Gammaproteobacteria bacterium]|nr:SAM-dependent methyltransferase [Gammaproteobacteria bacterium]